MGQILIDKIKNEACNIFIHNTLEKMDQKSLNNLLTSLKELNQKLSKINLDKIVETEYSKNN